MGKTKKTLAGEVIREYPDIDEKVRKRLRTPDYASLIRKDVAEGIKAGRKDVAELTKELTQRYEEAEFIRQVGITLEDAPAAYWCSNMGILIKDNKNND